MTVVRVTSGVEGTEARGKEFKLGEGVERVEEVKEVDDGKTLAPSLVALGAARRVLFRRFLAVAAPAAIPHKIPIKTMTMRPMIIRPRLVFHHFSLGGVGDGTYAG